MGDLLSADEVARKYRRSMDPNLSALFHPLWNECAWLHLKWDEYVSLFGTNPERIKILNCAAGAFFRVVQDSLYENVLLHLCRMTDPPKTAGKNNLTVRRLPDLVSSEISQDVKELVRVATERCSFARDWRNRKIAHCDLTLALKMSATPLAAASRKNVKQALAAIAAVINAVSLYYENSKTIYGKSPSLDNAEALLYVLRDGLEVQEEFRKRAVSGRHIQKDFEPPPPL